MNSNGTVRGIPPIVFHTTMSKPSTTMPIKKPFGLVLIWAVWTNWISVAGHSHTIAWKPAIQKPYPPTSSAILFLMETT
ncbi:hypothetical protein EVA_04618 [gut metagenome]|uniref:Uncharacterized protein n=1 Tax=gut metagenome TaxID=749906 RepID=J9H1H8_9ZZZZ